MTYEEREVEMMDMLRMLWPKSYGRFPFKIGEGPNRAFHEAGGESDEDAVVYGIVYKGSVLHWVEVEEKSILPKGKRRKAQVWVLDRLYPVSMRSEEYGAPPEMEWADEAHFRSAAEAAIAFTTLALSESMYEMLMERGFA